MPGVQTLVPVLLTLSLDEGLFSLNDFARLASEAPARLYGIKGKGALLPGFDADLTIVDLEKQWILERPWIKSKCGWSPYEGKKLRGLPIHTVVHGQFAMRDGELSETAYGTIPEFG